MQGIILSASVTGNQGLILGDDGSRYTFTSRSWQDYSAKAFAGMRVEFKDEGAFATNVVAVGDATPAPYVQSPGNSWQSTPVASRAYANIRQEPQHTPRDSVSAPGSAQEETKSRTAARNAAWAEAKKLRLIEALLLFLGPIGAFIFEFVFVGVRMTAPYAFCLVLCLILLPLLYLLYPIFFIVAVILLLTSNWGIDKMVHRVHVLREHGEFAWGCRSKCPHTSRSVCYCDRCLYPDSQITRQRSTYRYPDHRYPGDYFPRY